MKTRATRATIAFLRGLISSEEVPIHITIDAGNLVAKLVRECKANGIKPTKNRKRRKRVPEVS